MGKNPRKKKERTIRVSEAIPEDFIRNMESCIGAEEAAALADALKEEPSVSIRLNKKKVKDYDNFMKRFEKYGVSPVTWCRSGFYLRERPDFIHDPLLHAGTYYVQEAASMYYETIVSELISGVLKAPDGHPLRVLDLCAAPGGKTTAMLNALEGDYEVVANEYDRSRARILKENLDKWGDPNVIVTNSPAAALASLEERFDIVAVDAPCSGEGMMRREPVARAQWNTGLVEQCYALQRDILGNAVRALRPGGALIYSTCTFNSVENEGNAEWIASELGLEPVGATRRFMPHREKCEGLFVAVFKKPDPGIPSQNRRKSTLELLREARVNIISEGIEKNVRKGELEIPSSRQVLACNYDSDSFPAVALSLPQALVYLRRDTVRLPDDTPTGYVAVSFDGYPLGLVKNLGNRANNLYPPEWKIKT